MLHSQISSRAVPRVFTSQQEATHEPALVHIVDIDPGAQQLVSRWLGAAGIESQTYAHLGEFLGAQRANVPGCLVIDAQPPAISGVELQAILLPFTIHCPIVVAAHRAHATMTIGSSKSAAIVVNKPLHEWEVVAAVCAAIAMDRQQRLLATRRADLRARFAKLSPRERQVMSMVASGMLNKQVGGDLGLSEITIKAHRGAAMRKMGARSLADLVRMADALVEQPG
jgi:FixJ family two-component response regulator